jgi:hypothetical protein
MTTQVAMEMNYSKPRDMISFVGETVCLWAAVQVGFVPRLAASACGRAAEFVEKPSDTEADTQLSVTQRRRNFPMTSPPSC